MRQWMLLWCATVFLGSVADAKESTLTCASADACVYGAPKGVLSHWSASSGDLNGDGRDDLVLGFANLSDDPSRPVSGMVYVLYGRDSLPAVMDPFFEWPDVLIQGADESDSAGYAVLVADVDCDGIGDLIISANSSRGPANSRPIAGEVYVLRGGNLPGYIDLATHTSDLIVYGQRPWDRLAFTLEKGDLNSDMCDDLLLGVESGAGQADPPPGQFGQALVVFGSRSLPPVIDLSTQRADVTVYGARTGDRFGISLRSADVNFDSVEDLVVGSGDSNKVWVLFGGPGLAGVHDLHVNPPDLLIEKAGTLAVGSAVGAGDVNADGVADIIMASPEEDLDPTIDPTPHGRTYVAFGRVAWPATLDLTSGADSVVFEPDYCAAGPPVRIIKTWDLNHDGVDDLLISAARGGTLDNPDSGRILVEYGSPSFPTVVDYRSGGGDLVLNGKRPEEAGTAVAFGDLNGDSRNDLVICSPFADPDPVRPRTGVCYIFLGNDCRAEARVSPAGPLSVCEGGTASLDGSASTITGCGTPQYEWTLDGAVVAGAVGTTFQVPTDLLEGPHTVYLGLGCAEAPLCASTSAAVVVDVLPGPERVTQFYAVRQSQDILFQWSKEASSAGGYRLYRVASKRDIAFADGRNPAAVRVGSVPSVDTVDFTERNAVPGDLAYYQVVGVCSDGTTEGPH